MNPDDEVKYHELRLLISEALSGTISSEDLANLEEILKADSDNRKYYIEYLHVHSGLRNIFSITNPDSTLTADGFELDLTQAANSVDQIGTDSYVSIRGADIKDIFKVQRGDVKNNGFDEDEEIDLDMLEILELVRTSPAVEIPKEQPKRELIKKVVYPPREKVKMTFFHKFALAACAAAILFFAFVYFMPQQNLQSIAHISQSVDARWLSAAGHVDVGSELYPGPLSLKEGFGEIILDSGVRVILEAPVEIDLETVNSIYLNKGRLVADIGNSVVGRFVVRTDNSTVVDYGTEFGVEVDERGRTYAHVFKGKVELRQGSDPLKFDNTIKLNAGQSGKCRRSGELVRFSGDPDIFIRTIPSPYECAVKKTKPLYYWRFDHDQNGLLRNETEPHFNKISRLYGSVDYIYGRDLGSNKNIALQFTGRPGDYAVLREYVPQADDKAGFSMVMWVRSQEIPKHTSSTIITVTKDDGLGIGNRFRLSFNGKYREYSFIVSNLLGKTDEGDLIKQGVRVRSNSIKLDTWYHLAVTYTANQRVKLYLNGHLHSSKMLTGAVEPLGYIHSKRPIKWCIGQMDSSSKVKAKPDDKVTFKSVPFKGSLDEISQYDRELSANEVKMLYEASKKKL